MASDDENWTRSTFTARRTDPQVRVTGNGEIEGHRSIRTSEAGK